MQLDVIPTTCNIRLLAFLLICTGLIPIFYRTYGRSTLTDFFSNHNLRYSENKYQADLCDIFLLTSEMVEILIF